MIKFYTNKELASQLKINLARWKRWSREFLPPDPLGGLQSGYARQYNPDDAFTIYIGGHLVGELKFSIPEAREILEDLNLWLTENNFYFSFSKTDRTKTLWPHPVEYYQIIIIRHHDANGRHCGHVYLVRGFISVEFENHHGMQLRKEYVIESAINPQLREYTPIDVESHRVLNISVLRKNFLNSLSSDLNAQAATV
jgi:hypothetical protein